MEDRIMHENGRQKVNYFFLVDQIFPRYEEKYDFSFRTILRNLVKEMKILGKQSGSNFTFFQRIDFSFYRFK